jgi:hypothetical protein
MNDDVGKAGNSYKGITAVLNPMLYMIAHPELIVQVYINIIINTAISFNSFFIS